MELVKPIECIGLRAVICEITILINEANEAQSRSVENNDFQPYFTIYGTYRFFTGKIEGFASDASFPCSIKQSAAK